MYVSTKTSHIGEYAPEQMREREYQSKHKPTMLRRLWDSHESKVSPRGTAAFVLVSVLVSTRMMQREVIGGIELFN